MRSLASPRRRLFDDDGLERSDGRMAGRERDRGLEAWDAPETEEEFGEQTVLIWRDRGLALLLEAAEARMDSAAVVCEHACWRQRPAARLPDGAGAATPAPICTQTTASRPHCSRASPTKPVEQ